MNEAVPPVGTGPVAIICGGGSFPFVVADALIRQGRRAILFPLHPFADAEAVERYPHYWVRIGQMGYVVRTARKESCRDVIFIGTVVRPAIREIRLDWMTLRLMPRIVRLFYGGDDYLISGVVRLVEEQGFRVMGAHEVAPEILMPAGPLGAKRPSTRDEADIARGIEILHATGPFDIGQAVVVAGNHVLALEAAEGTDQMLERVAELRKNGRIRAGEGAGVLIKAPKPTQDRRFDLPSIGPRTIEGVKRAGLAGLAVTAGGTIVAEPERIVEVADRSGLFVVGFGGGAI
ncbi:MAG: UDP-2,3-diacylglucosamine diphosphatase LpxI [Pseudorhodoplanes sp.]|nr:UDP-2,3-diacylglucosamine diphosphatase LpxI [Pseudorhodoplanes sp.]